MRGSALLDRRPGSFDEAPSGEAEEDVFEARAAHEARDRVQPGVGDAHQLGLAVVAVDEDAVGQHLDAVADAREPLGDLVVAVAARSAPRAPRATSSGG